MSSYHSNARSAMSPGIFPGTAHLKWWKKKERKMDGIRQTDPKPLTRRTQMAVPKPLKRELLTNQPGKAKEINLKSLDLKS